MLMFYFHVWIKQISVVVGFLLWLTLLQRFTLPVTMLISSSWLRWLDDDSDKLELAELNGWSEGHGEGGPLVIKRANVW